ncbi:hypothetical protein J6590_029433 [Homalodisca vitripennis]|nr:hypothetical protein J6590_029433 [Homalodisca vitripennis]
MKLVSHTQETPRVGQVDRNTAIGIHKAKGQFIDGAVLMSCWEERIIGILQEFNAKQQPQSPRGSPLSHLQRVSSPHLTSRLLLTIQQPPSQSEAFVQTICNTEAAVAQRLSSITPSAGQQSSLDTSEAFVQTICNTEAAVAQRLSSITPSAGQQSSLDTSEAFVQTICNTEAAVAQRLSSITPSAGQQSSLDTSEAFVQTICNTEAAVAQRLSSITPSAGQQSSLDTSEAFLQTICNTEAAVAQRLSSITPSAGQQSSLDKSPSANHTTTPITKPQSPRGSPLSHLRRVSSPHLTQSPSANHTTTLIAKPQSPRGSPLSHLRRVSSPHLTQSPSANHTTTPSQSEAFVQTICNTEAAVAQRLSSITPSAGQQSSLDTVAFC